jgi:hypothetical protein
MGRASDRRTVHVQAIYILGTLQAEDKGRYLELSGCYPPNFRFLAIIPTTILPLGLEKNVLDLSRYNSFFSYECIVLFCFFS